MKIWTVSEGTPCLVIRDVEGECKPVAHITTVESRFDYPFWDLHQVHNRGKRYLEQLVESRGYNCEIAKLVSTAVELGGMIAFTKETNRGKTALMLVGDNGLDVQLLC